MLRNKILLLILIVITSGIATLIFAFEWRQKYLDKSTLVPFEPILLTLFFFCVFIWSLNKLHLFFD